MNNKIYKIGLASFLSIMLLTGCNGGNNDVLDAEDDKRYTNIDEG